MSASRGISRIIWSIRLCVGEGELSLESESSSVRRKKDTAVRFTSSEREERFLAVIVSC